MFTLGGAVVSWKSLKQMIIPKSTMEYEFIALEKCGEEVEWLCHFLEDIQDGQNMCLQYAYIVIVNLLLIEHKTVCIMVSLDIFVVYTTPLDNYSQQELSH